MLWQYGLITVPSRFGGLLTRTLRSLAQGGFSDPHLFVDGGLPPEGTMNYTARVPAARTAVHWTLAIAELYLRDPSADRYAIFQDDLVCFRHLREYLEACAYPSCGYWNCYTAPKNERWKPRKSGFKGWYPSNQKGYGALALVFDNEAVLALLTSAKLATRPMLPKKGWQAIDGAVVTVLAQHGIREYVHAPSLVQHTGDESVMGHRRGRRSVSFMDESFDALQLVTGGTSWR